ncbi:MAG: mechanosensitive ion channel family protein [Candidatus Hydrogenedentota bacterium]|nr:MAG: mechanosensitive ion channel family protein [Candidatus Hydrogenedentota bacterium]
MFETIAPFFNQRPILIYAAILVASIILWFLLSKGILRLFKSLYEKSKKEKSLLFQVFFQELSPNSFFLSVILVTSVFLFLFPIQEDVQSYLSKAIIVSFILMLTINSATWLAVLWIKTDKKREKNVSSILQLLIKLLVYLSGGIIILNYLDIQLAPIITALGVGGLAVALALQDTLSNLFAGMQILATGQIRTGDFVKLESGEEGYIVDIKWRNTEIRTLLDNIIIIPNSKLANSVTRNYFLTNNEMYFHVLVSVDYSSNLEKVEKVILEEARKLQEESELFPSDYQPKVRFYEFADSGIECKIWLAASRYEHQFLLRHEFMKRLHKRFKKEKIVIPFPIRTVYMKK